MPIAQLLAQIFFIVGVELCWPYRAQQKGSVENLVGFVKSSFFKVRRFHEGHAYSMPPEAISMPATLYLYGQRVRIVAGSYQAEHPRKFSAQENSSLPEHRAALVAAVSGRRGKRYLKRQQLLELGESAIRYLTEIVHRRPRQWYEDVERLHQILQSHGAEVLRRAMEEGLEQQKFGALYVERSLESGLSFPEMVQ